MRSRVKEKHAEGEQTDSTAGDVTRGKDGDEGRWKEYKRENEALEGGRGRSVLRGRR